MIKAKDVNTSNVSSEQIGRCHKVFSGSIPFYMVESEEDALTEYKVTWDRKHGFTCTCEAGQHGFSKCRDGICKHVRWSVAASREERQAAICVPQAPVVSSAPTIDVATRARIEAANSARRARSARRLPIR